MNKGFTLVEVAIALLLLGVVAAGVFALAQILQSSQQPELEEWVVLENLIEGPASSAVPTCPMSANITLGGRTYPVCRESIVQAGLGYTRRVESWQVVGGVSLTRVRVTVP